MNGDLLLIIDMQKVYAEGGAWHCPGVEEAAKRIREIYTSNCHNHVNEKNRDIPDVIFTRFIARELPVGVWKDYNVENQAVNEAPVANEMLDLFKEDLEKYPLYTKGVYSSLGNPQVLQAVRGVRDQGGSVIVAGVVAECCVLATVMALIDEGVPVIYLTDGVAGLNEEMEAAVELVLSGLEPLHVKRMTIEAYINNHCCEAPRV